MKAVEQDCPPRGPNGVAELGPPTTLVDQRRIWRDQLILGCARAPSEHLLFSRDLGQQLLAEGLGHSTEVVRPQFLMFCVGIGFYLISI